MWQLQCVRVMSKILNKCSISFTLIISTSKDESINCTITINHQLLLHILTSHMCIQQQPASNHSSITAVHLYFKGLNLSSPSKLQIWLITQQTTVLLDHEQTSQHCCYYFFLCCEPFWANHPIKAFPPQSSWKHLEAERGILQEIFNVPESLDFWSRMIRTWPLSAFIIPALSVRIAADCVSQGHAVCFYSLLRHDEVVTWADWATNRLQWK